MAARGARQRRAALGLAEEGFRRRAAPEHVAHVDVGELQQHKQALKSELTKTLSQLVTIYTVNMSEVVYVGVPAVNNRNVAYFHTMKIILLLTATSTVV